MHKLFSTAIFLVAFLAPFLLVLWWGRRNLRFWILLMILIISGWMLIVCEALIFKLSNDANFYEWQLIPGHVPTMDQALDNNHVGDVAIALVLGWIIPVAGAGLGSVIAKFSSSSLSLRKQKSS